jgi:hypothetical protein
MNESAFHTSHKHVAPVQLPQLILGEDFEVPLKRLRVDNTALACRLLSLTQRKQQRHIGIGLLEDVDVGVGVHVEKHEVRVVEDRRIAVLCKDLAILVLMVRRRRRLGRENKTKRNRKSKRATKYKSNNSGEYRR